MLFLSYFEIAKLEKKHRILLTKSSPILEIKPIFAIYSEDIIKTGAYIFVQRKFHI